MSSVRAIKNRKILITFCSLISNNFRNFPPGKYTQSCILAIALCNILAGILREYFNINQTFLKPLMEVSDCILIVFASCLIIYLSIINSSVILVIIGKTKSCKQCCHSSTPIVCHKGHRNLISCITISIAVILLKCNKYIVEFIECCRHFHSNLLQPILIDRSKLRDSTNSNISSIIINVTHLRNTWKSIDMTVWHSCCSKKLWSLLCQCSQIWHCLLIDIILKRNQNTIATIINQLIVC